MQGGAGEQQQHDLGNGTAQPHREGGRSQNLGDENLSEKERTSARKKLTRADGSSRVFAPCWGVGLWARPLPLPRPGPAHWSFLASSGSDSSSRFRASPDRSARVRATSGEGGSTPSSPADPRRAALLWLTSLAAASKGRL